MRHRRQPGGGLLRALVWAMAGIAAPSLAGSSTTAVGLNDTRAKVAQRLGVPLRASHPSHCPRHLVELRRRGSLWLKLVYGPDDRVRAAGVFRLSLPTSAGTRQPRRIELRWPRLVPGAGGRSAYPAAEAWRPLLWSIGAKQWLWIEESHGPTAPADRTRYLGGVVVDNASGFASGTDFPYDVAEAVTATGLSGVELAHAEITRPLQAWRRRTPPNVYIETLASTDEQNSACGPLTLVMPNHTDFVLSVVRDRDARP